MNLDRRRLFSLAMIFVFSLILSVFFSDMVYQFIVAPIIYFFLFLQLLYRAVPQPILWTLLVFVLLSASINSLAGLRAELTQFFRPRKRIPGPVEDLSVWMQRRGRGVYYRWSVARMLGEVALFIAGNDESGIKKLDWGAQPPSPKIQEYLDAALNTSFAAYPTPHIWEKRPVTPFDLPLEVVLDELEKRLQE